MFPATPWEVSVATVCGPEYVSPPSFDTNVSTLLSDPLSIGTTTVPFGCARGWPPITLAEGTVDANQEAPPSVERLMFRWLPAFALSHWT